MISKGANDWGLSYACFGGHKEIVLLMIEKGADMNKCSMTLNNVDLEYLIKKEVELTKFGILLGDTVRGIRQVIRVTMLVISNKIPCDLVNLCINY